MAIELSLRCDNCKDRFDDGAYAYCQNCWDELLDENNKLKDTIWELERQIKNAEEGET